MASTAPPSPPTGPNDVLTPRQTEGVRHYMRLRILHRERLAEALAARVARHSRLSEALGALPPEKRSVLNFVNEGALEAAVEGGDWGPLMAQLKAHGARFAQEGIEIEIWFELLSTYRAAFLPLLVSEYAHDPATLELTLDGANRVIDLAASCMSSGYLDAKEDTIRAQAAAAQRLASIVTSSNDAILSKDLNGSITSWNLAAQRLFGYSAEEIVGRSIMELVPPESMPEERQLAAEIAAGRQVNGLVTERLDKSRRRIPVAITVSPMADPSGRIVGASTIIRDLTEQLQGRREVEMWTRAFQHAGMAMAIASATGEFIALNPAFATLYGYEVQELVGQPSQILRGTPDPRELDSVVEHLLQAGHGRYHIPSRRKDGTVFPSLVDATAVRSATGEVLYRFVTVHDRSAELRAEAALRASEERKAAILDAALDAVITVDHLGRILEVNRAAVEMFGYTAEELHLADLESTLVPPEYRRRHLDGMRRYLETGHGPILGNRRELSALRKDGSVFPIEITVVRIGEDSPPTFTSFIRDITQQRQVREELHQAEARLKNIINSMPSLLVGVDGRGRVTHWNHRAEELTGLPLADALGQLATEVLPQLRLDMEDLDLAIRSREPLRHEKVPTEVEGQPAIVDVLVYPLVTNGVIGAVIRMDDITNRVRIEEMMVQSEKMQSVGSLAAGMAHEINNPLGAILQGCQNVRRRIDPSFGQNRQAAEALGLDLTVMDAYLRERRVVRFLDGIQEAGERAARIVSDMLTFSRRSHSAFSLNPLPEIIDASLRLAYNDYDLKKLYDFRHVRIVRVFSPDLPPIRSDAINLQQVFLNLFKNAAQAMSEARTIDPTIAVTASRDGDEVIVQVRDNGPGMGETVRRRAFEPFFTTKQVGVGTGLGLSVCYFIVSQHGGSIGLDSTVGEGSLFTLRLPIR